MVKKVKKVKKPQQKKLILTTKAKEQPKEQSELALIFTAISPKVILPNFDFKIVLFVEVGDQQQQNQTNKAKSKATKKSAPALHFSAKITSTKETFSNLNEVSLSPGKTGTLTIQIPELKPEPKSSSSGESEYKLILTVRDDVAKISKTFEADVFTRKLPRVSQVSLLAHTDKGIYKPGDKVKFRIVVLNPNDNFRPFPDPDSTSKLVVKIFDPDQNLVKMWTEASAHFGIFSSEFQLSTDPIFGDWEIHYEGRLKNQNQQGNDDDDEKGLLFFSVEKYILPKFKMDITLPPFISFSDEKVKVTAEVKYTHGGGVRGQLKLTPNLTPKIDPQNDPLAVGEKGQKTTGGEILSIDNSGILQTEIEYNHLLEDLKKQLFFYEKRIFVHAEFTDEITGKKIEKESSVQVYEFPYKIQLWSKPPTLIKGIEYTLFIKILMQDDSPVKDFKSRLQDDLKISHKPSPASALTSGLLDPDDHLIQLPFEQTGSDGIVKIVFDASATSEIVEEQRFRKFQIKFRELTEIHWAQIHYSSDLLVYINNNNQDEKHGENEKEELQEKIPVIKRPFEINVSVVDGKPLKFVNYFIIESTMNKILACGRIDFPSLKNTQHFKISCPKELASAGSGAETEATLFIFTFFETMKSGKYDFLVRNSGTKEVQNILKMADENFLDISLSRERSEPAENIIFKINTGKKSMVALKAVDESVLLLKKNGDIDSSAISSAMARERAKRESKNETHANWDSSDSIGPMNLKGLRVITNGSLKEVPDYTSLSLCPPGPVYIRPTTAPAPARVRMDFPETWIWEESFTESGILNLDKIVPDSLTSWIITGFSISSEFGIAALPAPKKLSVTREFFLDLNLPFSVILGEILHLQVLIYNYNSEKKEILAEVTLENSEGKFEFEFWGEDASTLKSLSKKVTVKSDSTSSVTFPIKPVKIGSIDLKVKGSSGLKYSDALSKQLTVIPPGQRESQSVAVLLTPSDKNIQLAPVFPEHSVRLDDSIKISAISDLLGATIENMENLIQMPYGCGEQNMLNFVVDIVVLEYLEFYSSFSKKALHPGVKERAIKYMESGYQRELGYRRKDGSFSCFGKNDANGSTWLTAFVLRSFLKASAFINIEDQVISQAVGFLMERQEEESGRFEEKGTVHDSGLVGNSGSQGVSLTAFCIFALLEKQSQVQKQSKDSQDDYLKIIQKGLDFILQGTKDNNAGSEKELYALILTTYALHLASHKEKDKYFQKMEKTARKERDLVFWGSADSSSDHEKKVKPVWIEMTGYALLIYMLREGNSKSHGEAKTLPIVKWLLKHRNSKGGFISTQDTVVGLSAIAQFARETQNKDGTVVDLEIVAAHENEELKIRVNEENSIILQEFVLPPSTSSVSLSATGKGSALVQLSWYYFLQAPVKQPAFSLDVTVQENPGNGIVLKICTSFILAAGESKSESDLKSNMAILEVNFPSGFSVDKEMLSELEKVENYKKYETENQDNRLNIYFESLSKTPTVVNLEGVQMFKVVNAKEAFVSVFDYYDSTRRARTFYSLPFSSDVRNSGPKN